MHVLYYYTRLYRNVCLSILLAPHCDCTYVCLRACIHVIWCNYCYCIAMVLCCLAWYGFLWPVLASCDDHSWHANILSLGRFSDRIELIHLQVSNEAICQSLSIYFHAWPCFIISSSHPDEPESQPLRSLQERDILQLPLHRLVLGPAAQHSLTWRTDTNQQFTFLQCQIPLSWITKSSLNSTANSHLSVPNLHRTAPLTFWSKAARTKVSLIRMNTAWKEELKRIKKKRKIKWELYGDINGFRPLQLGYGAIWVQVDFNTLWNHTLRLLVLLSCQMLP